jgi:2-amino-4-hydroxy-6-hydroxymethyldihydropteridine diphosphokinase
MSQKITFLALGSNLGDRARNLESALERLETGGVRVLLRSSIYETAPQEFLDQPWFLNQVVKAETGLFPLQLLRLTQRVEREMGRERGPAAILKGPRLIDIDILLFGQAAIDTPQLVIPHPAMLERRFVLEPLVEIAPDLRHPVTGKSFASTLPQVKRQQIRFWPPKPSP